MKLKVINSNSKGNAYILEGENCALLIECGVKFDQIKQAIDFNVSKIDGCLFSHEHKDHSKSILDVIQNGIVPIASNGTLKACDVGGLIIQHGQLIKHKDWIIRAFAVEHDAAEPLGFIVEHPECGKVLFITDTYRLKWNFPQEFDHVIIEANYCEDMAEEMRNRKGSDIVDGRRLTNHMSFQTAKLTLERLNLSNCKNIVLIHLSDGLTNERAFKQEIEETFGIPTTVASPNIEIDFSLNPY